MSTVRTALFEASQSLRDTGEHGIATSLLRDAIARSMGERLSALFLLTTTAQSYFPRFGFEVFPRDRAPEGIRGSWEFRTGCPQTAVFMRKVLVHVR
jgi:amino-acid N-acetyltransferase